MRLTRDGLVMALVTAGVLAVGAAGGRNPVVLVGAGLVALWTVEIWLGGWNLHGLTVGRRLPSEVYAGGAARGALRVVNTGKRGAAWAITAREEGHEDAASVASLPAGRDAEVALSWRFPRRGVASLHAVVLASRWPFGWVERTARLPLPAEVVVWPTPRPGRGALAGTVDGSEQDGGRHEGPWGDFAGLRLYRAGDRARAIHWPTTARTGEATVAMRREAAGASVWVRVPERVGPAREAALGAACGEVVRATRAGLGVGLHLDGRTLPIRAGARWRRVLLDALARAPERR